MRKKLFMRFERCAQNFLFLVATCLCSPKERMLSASSWSNWARAAAWLVYFCRDPDLQQMCVQKSPLFTPLHLYRLRAAQACYWPRETPEGLTKQIGNHKPQLLTDKLGFLYYFWPIIQCIITLDWRKGIKEYPHYDRCFLSVLIGTVVSEQAFLKKLK